MCRNNFLRNEHRCASRWCWCSPTRRTTSTLDCHMCNSRPPSGDPDGAYNEGRSCRRNASPGSQVATGRGWLPYQCCKYSRQTGQFGTAVGPPAETGAGEVRFSMVTYLVWFHSILVFGSVSYLCLVPFHTCVWFHSLLVWFHSTFVFGSIPYLCLVPFHTCVWLLYLIWVGIRLKPPLGNAAYVACLPLLCQGSEWLNGKSIRLVFRRSWVRIQLDPEFFSMDLFLIFSTNKKKNIIHECLLSSPVNNIQPLYLI